MMNKYVYVIRLDDGKYLQSISFDYESDLDAIILNPVINISQALRFSSLELADSCCCVLADYGYQSMPMSFHL